MALYEVRSTDVQPGGFDNALVVASGTMQARKAVAHLNGDSVKNLVAERRDTSGGVAVLSVYWDERTPEPSAAEADPSDWLA